MWSVHCSTTRPQAACETEAPCRSSHQERHWEARRAGRSSRSGSWTRSLCTVQFTHDGRARRPDPRGCPPTTLRWDVLSSETGAFRFFPPRFASSSCLCKSAISASTSSSSISASPPQFSRGSLPPPGYLRRRRDVAHDGIHVLSRTARFDLRLFDAIDDHRDPEPGTLLSRDYEQ